MVGKSATWGGRELEKRGNWKSAASVYQRLWDQGESTNAKDRLQARSRLLPAGKAWTLAHEVCLQSPLSWIQKTPNLALPPRVYPGTSESCGQRRCTPTRSATGLDPHRAEWFYRKAQCEHVIGRKGCSAGIPALGYSSRPAAMPNSIRVWASNC